MEGNACRRMRLVKFRQFEPDFIGSSEGQEGIELTRATEEAGESVDD